MRGKITHRSLCTAEPISEHISVDDVVLCKVKGSHYLHLVKAKSGVRYFIGNNVGGTNGWITKKSIYGKLTRVE
ncbi:uncharacterized protein BDZ99DRAFT_463822 [Mytilinidion resinicola]|uniref:SH3 domain-containing protein n=1 Tax=Mytilinidion resinicola TaxID=574789 RepID=A0A6A6YJE7_9PEZI|nr:uncharacterized protein BDZ99DRAFT_463822 [Mytilinidion resinicola]KAF2808972.1 hypothetical protein BDZ99DRAFT_463822 [Mytilinidion resinicola]